MDEGTVIGALELEQGLSEWFAFVGSSHGSDRARALGDLPESLTAWGDLEKERKHACKRARGLLRAPGVSWDDALAELGEKEKDEEMRLEYARLALTWVQLHVLLAFREARRADPNGRSILDAAQLVKDYFYYDQVDLLEGKTATPIPPLLLDSKTHSACLGVMQRLGSVLGRVNEGDGKAVWRAVCDVFEEGSLTEAQADKHVARLVGRTNRWLRTASSAILQVEEAEGFLFVEEAGSPPVAKRAEEAPESERASKRARTDSPPDASHADRAALTEPAQFTTPNHSPPKSRQPVEQPPAPASGQPSLSPARMPAQPSPAQEADVGAAVVDVVTTVLEQIVEAGAEPDAAPPNTTPASSTKPSPQGSIGSSRGPRRVAAVLRPASNVFARLFGSRAGSAPVIPPARPTRPATTTTAAMPLAEVDGGANGVTARAKSSPRKDAPFTFSQGVPIVEANLEPAMASKLSSKAYKPAASEEVPYLKLLEAKARAGRPKTVAEPAVDTHDDGAEPDPSRGVFAAVSAASSNGSSMGEEADGVISDSEALVAREGLLVSP